LAKKPRLAITYDLATNSILVANATAAQLREIEDLIKELDRPVLEDVKASHSRVTTTIKVKYSRASIIAAALKEVYIDLLSSRDREFATGDERRSDTSSKQYMTQFKFGDSNGAIDGASTKLQIAFNGELSVGADDVSNNLLISCREELFDGVAAMIKKLDEEAAPPMGLYIHEIEGSLGADPIQKAMSDSLGRAWLGGRPEDQIARGGPQQPGQNQGQNGQPQGNRGNRGRRGR
jgi:type II secretory pathway component GspD/PulD (secretin)